MICPKTKLECTLNCANGADFIGAGSIIACRYDEAQRLFAPPALPNAEVYENSDLSNDWWIVVYPATDLHHKLAKKLAGNKSGQLVPLTVDEISLLSEFMVWPKPPRTA